MNQLATQKTAQAQQVPAVAERLIDRVFEQLTASCPVLLSVKPEQLKILKQQWILGFAENGITQFEQVKRGMVAMRAKENGYLPSVGEFIKACFEGFNHELGLPELDELERRYRRFAGMAKYEPHRFEYLSAAEYDLLRTLYYKYNKRPLEELLKAMPKALDDQVLKVRKGYVFDPIPEMLEEKKPVFDPEEAKRGIAMMKAALYGAVQ